MLELKCQENARAIAQQIKTSGGGSASQDYSTTEHVVGKWIDGESDVYEKTIAFTPESTISSSTNIATITGATLIMCLSASAYNSGANRGVFIPLNASTTGTDLSFNAGVITLNITNDEWSTAWTFYITVRYLKSVS